MNLVQDDEPILRVVEIERGLRQTAAVVTVLKVEIERVPCPADLQSQRGLANLPRPDHGDGGLALQGVFDVAGDDARDHHPLNLSTMWTICKDVLACPPKSQPFARASFGLSLTPDAPLRTLLRMDQRERSI